MKRACESSEMCRIWVSSVRLPSVPETLALRAGAVCGIGERGAGGVAEMDPATEACALLSTTLACTYRLEAALHLRIRRATHPPMPAPRRLADGYNGAHTEDARPPGTKRLREDGAAVDEPPASAARASGRSASAATSVTVRDYPFGREGDPHGLGQPPEEELFQWLRCE